MDPEKGKGLFTAANCAEMREAECAGCCLDISCGVACRPPNSKHVFTLRLGQKFRIIRLSLPWFLLSIIAIDCQEHVKPTSRFLLPLLTVNRREWKIF